MLYYRPTDRGCLLCVASITQQDDRFDTTVASEIPAVGQMYDTPEPGPPGRAFGNEIRIELFQFLIQGEISASCIMHLAPWSTSEPSSAKGSRVTRCRVTIVSPRLCG